MHTPSTQSPFALGMTVRYSPAFLAALRGAATARQQTITGTVITLARGTGVLRHTIRVRWADGHTSWLRPCDLIPIQQEA